MWQFHIKIVGMWQLYKLINTCDRWCHMTWTLANNISSDQFILVVKYLNWRVNQLEILPLLINEQWSYFKLPVFKTFSFFSFPCPSVNMISFCRNIKKTVGGINFQLYTHLYIDNTCHMILFLVTFDCRTHWTHHLQWVSYSSLQWDQLFHYLSFLFQVTYNVCYLWIVNTCKGWLGKGTNCFYNQ